MGGCLIPMGSVVYEITQLAAFGQHALIVTATSCVANVLICYLIARTVTGIGIVMSSLPSAAFQFLDENTHVFFSQ